jgi:hypothetical protein
MEEQTTELHPETLAHFQALERVPDLREMPRPASSRARVDSSGILELDPEVLGFPAATRPAAPVRAPWSAPRWLESNLFLAAVALLGLAALAMLAVLVLKLMR